MRLIDADELIDVLAEMQGLCQTKAALVQNSKIWQQVKGMPTIVQPEPKKGKWINAYPEIEPNPMFMYGICSVCGFEQSISDKLNFCPNCGADMRGEQP